MGPIVIGPFITTFKAELESDHPNLVDIGSCGMHRIHGACETGFETCNWELERYHESFMKVISISFLSGKVD